MLTFAQIFQSHLLPSLPSRVSFIPAWHTGFFPGGFFTAVCHCQVPCFLAFVPYPMYNTSSPVICGASPDTGTSYSSLRALFQSRSSGTGEFETELSSGHPYLTSCIRIVHIIVFELLHKRAGFTRRAQPTGQR
jgi:hypothetical protein